MQRKKTGVGNFNFTSSKLFYFNFKIKCSQFPKKGFNFFLKTAFSRTNFKNLIPHFLLLSNGALCLCLVVLSFQIRLFIQKFQTLSGNGAAAQDNLKSQATLMICLPSCLNFSLIAENFPFYLWHQRFVKLWLINWQTYII